MASKHLWDPGARGQAGKSIDGAGEWQIFSKIAMPLCKGGIISIAILVFIDYWNMVEQPLILLTNDEMHPLSVFLSKINSGEISLAFAVAVIYMVPPMLILTLAWSLKAMTDSLGAAEFVAGIVERTQGQYIFILPAVIFVIACVLSFATGTSWGTFGILIPITLKAFSLSDPDPSKSTLAIICVSACMAGAVCGDHCSPISDTTIMSSAGAQCNHIAHVSTQLPYALVCAGVSFITYLVAAFVKNAAISLLLGICMMVGMVLLLKFVMKPDSDASKPETQKPAKE